ncbi:GntR family transcriptional regulator [Nocardiopsis ansamitocini]|uniref:GntR family transcriptional regulator n=1 Tax=Nocardiopsis ansamitocini TaxID=1670832 RepID=A0A9W6P4C2_9ACTN|nr:GntR family transcriptional regulator [Nocardiopsis ansamitocini]GLU46980.1 GntR family transcriptional regulator [Nocardiopsis ansamitocini]
MNTGLYTAEDSGGLEESGPHSPTLAGGRTRSRREAVYGRLRHQVMSGHFPPWTRLAEERMARRLGVSRTPVREALTRLEVEGLVERRDGSFVVTVPNLAELRDLYELRVVLELRGVARAIEAPAVTHDRAVLEAELRRWYVFRDAPPAPDPQFVVRDEEFHHALSRASGNPAVTDALVGVNQKIRRVRMYDFLTADRIQTTIDEHIQIMEFVRDGELDRGYRALHAHVGESLEVVMERARDALTQMTLNAGTA